LQLSFVADGCAVGGYSNASDSIAVQYIIPYYKVVNMQGRLNIVDNGDEQCVEDQLVGYVLCDADINVADMSRATFQTNDVGDSDVKPAVMTHVRIHDPALQQGVLEDSLHDTVIPQKDILNDTDAKPAVMTHLMIDDAALQGDVLDDMMRIACQRSDMVRDARVTRSLEDVANDRPHLTCRTDDILADVSSQDVINDDSDVKPAVMTHLLLRDTTLLQDVFDDRLRIACRTNGILCNVIPQQDILDDVDVKPVATSLPEDELDGMSHRVCRRNVTPCHEPPQNDFVGDTDVKSAMPRTSRTLVDAPMDAMAPYTCIRCHGKFLDLSELKKHIRLLHIDETSYKCTMCSCCFRRPAALVEHMSAVHGIGETPYLCMHCLKSFALLSSFRKHMRIHEPVEYITDTSQGFWRHSKLVLSGRTLLNEVVSSSHSDAHHKMHSKSRSYIGREGSRRSGDLKKKCNKKQYLCNICGLSYLVLAPFKRHLKQHSRESSEHDASLKSLFGKNKKKKNHTVVSDELVGKSRYRCKLCDKSYNKRCKLVEHFRNHTGDEPYHCKLCDVKFKRRYCYTRHLRTHMSETPYNCNYCGAKFKVRDCYTKHLKIHNASETSYKCLVCSRYLTDASSLQRHSTLHSGEKPFKCHHCESSFAHQGTLIGHLRLHLLPSEKELVASFKCKHCRHACTSRSKLDEHMRIHTGEKPFVCGDCGKKFTRKAHLKLHTLAANACRKGK